MSSSHEKSTSNPDAGYNPASTNPPPYPGYPTIVPPPQEYPQPGYPQPGYPHPGYQPGPPPPQTTVFQGTTVIPGAVIIHSNIGPDPTRTTCYSCNETMVTRIEATPTMKTHLMAVLLCVLGCWPCVCLPYCMDSCLNTDHYCSKCGAFIGTYDR